jgi:golgin subfamily B member 1
MTIGSATAAFLETATVDFTGAPPTDPDEELATAVDGRPLERDTATVQQHLDDTDALVRRLERDPSDPVAGDMLEAIYTRRGLPEDVVGVLLDRAEVAVDVAERAGFLVRAAHLYRTQLADLEAARLVLATALAAAPGDRRVHDELDSVVCASGEFATARAAYADAAMAVGDRRLAGALWLRVASLHLMERAAPQAVCAALARIESLPGDGIDSTLELCERLAGDPMILDALAGLYRRIGDPTGASRVLSLSLDHVGDPAERARRHHAIGELAAGRGDDLEAEWHLAEALRLVPGRHDSRAALADVYRRRGQSRRAAGLLEEAHAAAYNPVDRANLASQAAAIYADELGEQTRALALYEMVLAADPERAEAAAPLAERHWQRGNFAQLEPLIEGMVRRAPDSAELRYRAGKTALELRKPERALEHLYEARRCEPRRADILRAASAAAAALGRFDDAFEALDAALELQADASGPELIESLVELAALSDKRGDAAGAIDLYRDALGRAPAHPRALAGATGLLRAKGDLVGVAEILTAASSVTDGEPRARVLAELAGLHAGPFGNREVAFELYRQALALVPDDREILAGLAELYTTTGAWTEAIETLGRLAGIEQDPVRRGRYHQIAAQLAKGRLDDDLTAALYTRALDCFFASGEPPAAQKQMCMRAFTDLESLLRARKAWKGLERAYRTMIKRLERDAPELPDLWTRLGVLYRKELGQAAAAIESFELAAALDGGRDTRKRVLVDLYDGLGAEQVDSLVARRWSLLRQEPTSAEHYRALGLLHKSANRRDHAFLALRALHALGAATPEEREQLARMDRRAVPSGPLGREHRARLRHQEEDGSITGILALATDAIAAELAVAPRRLPLRDDPSPRFQALRDLHQETAALVGVAPPIFYVQPELDVELVFANIAVEGRACLALVAGGRVVQASRADAAHSLARVLAYVRPAYILCVLLSEPGALSAAFDAALMVGGFRGRITATPAAHHFAGVLDRRLTPGFREHLIARVQGIREERRELSVDRWAAAVGATCRRTALLLSGELSAALAAVRREPASLRPAIDPVVDLLLHSCSEEHAQLRALLGLAVG